MTAEDKLSAFLNEGRAPEPAPAFEAAVMQRVAGRELVRSITAAGVLAGAGGVALWACAPILVRAIEPTAAQLAPIAAVGAFTVTVLLFGQSLIRRA